MGDRFHGGMVLGYAIGLVTLPVLFGLASLAVEIIGGMVYR